MALHITRAEAVRDQQLQPGYAAGVKRTIGSQLQDEQALESRGDRTSHPGARELAGSSRVYR
jgi:hypothetical protein